MIKHGSTTSLQRAKALANCAQDHHQWHPTFSLGEKLCLVVIKLKRRLAAST